ncbi:MAG: Isopentenyl-diphosphate Delta-isomerase [Candidatus Woesearchaeota archaeon]|nr:Isopentenyl-diphosphate Delta-isomerase [Candidatus Woesearchaeota archaeon]
MADELIDLVDENNNLIDRQVMKSKAHKKGLWHRSAHIWIYNSNKEVLLQLRAKDKKLFPNKWDMSVAGHVGDGEDVKQAAIREIKEEIGLEVDDKELEFVNIRKSKIDNGVKNYEFIYVFVLKYDKDIKDLKIHKQELQKIEFFPVKFVKKDFIENPDNYTIGKYYWLKMLDLINTKNYSA